MDSTLDRIRKRRKSFSVDDFKEREEEHNNSDTLERLKRRKANYYASTLGDEIESYASGHNKMVGDAEGYFSSKGYKSQPQYEGASNSFHNQKMDSIQKDARIRTILDKYGSYMDKEAVGNTRKALDNVSSNYREIGKSYRDDYQYRSQFKNKADYDETMKAYKNHKAMADYDLDKGKADLDTLTAKRDRANALKQRLQEIDSEMATIGYTGNYTEEWSKLNAEQKQIEAELKTIGNTEELDNTISEKTKYYNQAKRMQDTKNLETYAIEDKLYNSYVDKGRSAETTATTERKEANKNAKNIAGIDLGEDSNKYNDSYSKFNSLKSNMTEDEKDTFYYYMGKGDKKSAQAYLDGITDSVNLRQAESEFADLEGIEKGKTALELAFSMIAGGNQFASGMKNLGKIGDEYTPNSSTEYLSGMIREDLADNGVKIGSNSLGQIAYDMGTTTANMLPSILASAFTGNVVGMLGASTGLANMTGAVVGNASMGASVYGNAYKEMRNLGYTEDQSKSYAYLSALSETGLQYALGGVSKLGSQYTNAVKSVVAQEVAKKLDTSIGQIAVKYGSQLLGNMASEGIEESLQEILEPIFKARLTGEKLEAAKLEDVIYAGVLGALSAGLLEGASTVNEAAQVGRETKNVSKLRKADPKFVGNLKDIGTKFDVSSMAYEVVSKIDENSTSYDILNAIAEVNADIGQQTALDLTNYLKEEGLVGKDAKILTDYAVGILNGDITLNEEMVEALNLSEPLQKALTKVLDSNTTEYQRLNAIKTRTESFEKLKTDLAEVGKKNVKPQKAQEVAQETETEAPQVEESNLKAETEKPLESVTEQSIKVEETPEVAPKTEKSIVDDIVKAKKLDNDSEIAITSFMEMNKIPANKVDVVLNEYGYGYQNADYTSTDTFLTDVQKRYLRNLGKTARIKADAYYQNNQGVKAKPKDRGRLVNDVSADFDLNNLDSRQKASVNYAGNLAKITGTKIHIYNSVEKDGKYYYSTDIENGRLGRKGEEAQNGMFDSSTGEIYIDVNAGNRGEGLMLFTLSHEFTHFIRKNAPEQFNKLADYVFNTMYSHNTNANSLVLERASRESSYDAAMEETIADSLEQMLSSENANKHLNELYEIDKKLFEKLVDRLKQFVDAAKKVVEAYKNEGPMTINAAEVLKFSQNEYEYLNKIYAEALKVAADNYNKDEENNLVMSGYAKEMGGEVETNAEGDVVLASSKDKSTLMWSARTYDYGGREALAKALRLNGHTEKEIKTALESMDKTVQWIRSLTPINEDLAKHIEMNVEVNARDGKAILHTLTPNGDYPVNFDLSTICKKRKTYQGVINYLVREGIFDQVAFDGEAIAKINEILRSKGFETACPCCFVEAKRAYIQDWANKFVNTWNDVVDEVAKKQRIPLKNIENFKFYESRDEGASALTESEVIELEQLRSKYKKNKKGNIGLGKEKEDDSNKLPDKMKILHKKTENKLLKHISVNDIVSPKGLMELRSISGEMYSLLLQNYGQATPKITQEFSPYFSDAAKLTFKFLEDATGKAVKGKSKYEDAAAKELGFNRRRDWNITPSTYRRFAIDKTKQDLTEDDLDISYERVLNYFAIEHKAMLNYLYDIGGARSQSFSDFMIEDVFDKIQLYNDLAAQGFPLHEYTKEISSARIFGMTGAKENMSIIHLVDGGLLLAEGKRIAKEQNLKIPTFKSKEKEIDWYKKQAREFAGLVRDKETGKLTYAAGDFAHFNPKEAHSSFTQSIGWKDSIALMLDPRYSKNVGTIAIGFSDAHILMMLDDENIRMVIPYHRSGLPADFAEITNIEYAKDYTDYQEDKVAKIYTIDKTGKKIELKGKDKPFNSPKESFNFNAKLREIGDPRKTAKAYLDWCKEEHTFKSKDGIKYYYTIKPKFEAFSNHKNYYKVLEDFNTYDSITEKYAPQGAVTMNYATENQLSKAELEAYRERLTNRLDHLGNKIFTQAEVEKYVQKAQMSMEQIVEKELTFQQTLKDQTAPLVKEAMSEIIDYLKEHTEKVNAKKPDISNRADLIKNRIEASNPNLFAKAFYNDVAIRNSSRGKGYIGKSMSVNASLSYDMGEKPLSKWTKAALLEAIGDIKEIEGIEKLTVAELKKEFLKSTHWHHTGAFYNVTDFYEVNENWVNDFTQEDLETIIESREPKTKSAEERAKAREEKRLNEQYKVASIDIAKKLYIIGEAGTSGLKTETGLIKRLQSGKLDLEAEYQKAVDSLKAKRRNLTDEQFSNWLKGQEKGYDRIYKRKLLNSIKDYVKASKDIKNSSRDLDYMEAVESGNTTTADKLVRAEAIANGYDSPMLYHGTDQFGFTKFDVGKSDDRLTFFTTNKVSTAQSYSGTEKVKSVGGNPVPKEFEETVKKYNDTFGEGSIVPIDKEKAIKKFALKRMDHFYEAFNIALAAYDKKNGKENPFHKFGSNIDKFMENPSVSNLHKLEKIVNEIKPFIEKHFYEDMGAEYNTVSKFYTFLDIEITKLSNILKSEGLVEKVKNIVWGDDFTANLFTAEDITNALVGKGIYALYGKTKNMFEYDAEGRNWNDLPTDISKSKIKSLAAKYIEIFKGNIDEGVDYEDFDISKGHLESELEAVKDMLGIKESLYNTVKEMSHTLDEAYQEFKKVQEAEQKGTTYKDKFGISDIGTDDLSFGGWLGDYEYYDTRGLAKIVEGQGYDGVIIKNLFDDGGEGKEVTEAADVYIYFHPERDLKSADTVTYDDEGNIIPLSERFKETNDDIRYSGRDSEGNELTEAQAEFFKDSKARDKDGNLAVVHHGSKDYGFTVFDPKKSDDKRSLFFTDSRGMANTYVGDKSKIYNCYLNFKNPYIVNANGSKWNKIKISTPKNEVRKVFFDFADLLNRYDNEMDAQLVIENLGSLEEALYSIKEDDYEDFFDDSTMSLLLDMAKTIEEANENWDNEDVDFQDWLWEEKPKELTTRQISKMAEKQGYDGVIIRNVMDNGAMRKNIMYAADVYIAFNSNQVKSIDNKNPTSNDDIRYQNRNIGYHAGDLGKAEYLSTQGYSRDTGHFGTGTYFVGNEAQIQGESSYAKRPQHAVDFSNYNLYKPANEEQGYKLHSFLRFVDGLSLGLLNSKINNEEDLDKYKVYIDDALYDYEEAEDYENRSEAVENVIKEAYGTELGTNIINENIERNNNVYWRAYEDIERNLDRDRNLYRKINFLDMLKEDANELFGISPKEALDIIKEIYKVTDNLTYEEARKQDSKATRFMKTLGYEGVDVRGIKALDNTGYGSVIYDLKPDSVLYQNRNYDLAKEQAKAMRKLERENEILKEDKENLKKLVKIQGKLTHSQVFREKSLEAVAKSIMKKADAKGDKKELVSLLKPVYEYIAKGEDLTTENIKDKANASIDWLIEHREKVINEGAKEILDEIKGSQIILDSQQLQEVKSKYDNINGFKSALKGSGIKLGGNKAIDLDSWWQEKSEMYPYIFSPDVNTADMPIALAEAYESLSTSYDNEINEYMDFYRQDLYADVYDGYWDVSTLRSVADKYQKEINLLKASHKDKIDELREKNQADIQELKQKHSASVVKARDSRNRTEMRHKIIRKAKELNKLLLHESKDKHVPLQLKKSTIAALEAVNLDTVDAKARLDRIAIEIQKAKNPTVKAELQESYNRIKTQGDNMTAKLDALQKAYAEIQGSSIDYAYDQDIANAIERVKTVVGDKVFRNLSMEELQEIYNLYSITLQTIREANRTFKLNRRETIAELGDKVRAEIDGQGIVLNSIARRINEIKDFSWSNLKPAYAFKLIGSKTLEELYKNLRKGEDTWVKNMTESKDFYQNQVDKYHYNDWDMDKKYKLETALGDTIELSLQQLMSLYAFSRRDQAFDHLVDGGFVFSNQTVHKKKNKAGITVEYLDNIADRNLISPQTLVSIGTLLTKEQREFVETMQGYLSTHMADLGNEVTRTMYDIEGFYEENYFPLKSASQYLYKPSGKVEGEIKLKNASFTKGVVPHAKNPIILEDFIDVWAKHINEMSMYNAMVLPLEDFNRVFTYNSSQERGGASSVKASLQNRFGEQAVNYIDTFLKDLNGSVVSPPSVPFVDKMIGKFKKGAVFASASVVIQQYSAIIRAMAMVDPKYFAQVLKKAFNPKLHNAEWEELKKYAPIGQIKEMGYFDTNMAKSSVDWLTERQYEGVKEKAKAIFTDADYRDDLLSKAPALADEIAWVHIWEAVKKEQKALNPNLTGEAFLKQCGERFTDVVSLTQVYDSVFSRSEMMRSKNTATKMATSFMAEPTTNVNLMFMALLEAKRGNKKQAQRILGATLGSILLNSMLVAIVYAARDDDEDETYLEKYIGSFTGSFLDNINPATMIPYLKDIISIFEGYDVERADMSVIKDVYDGMKALSSDTLSPYMKVEKFGGAIANLFGLPLRNIMRDIRGMWNVISNDLGLGDTTAQGIKESVLDNLPIGRPTKKTDSVYDAYVSGDKTAIKRANADDTDIVKALRENDERIRKAAEMKAQGNMSGYKQIVLEIKAEKHFSQDQIIKAINSEQRVLTKSKADEKPQEEKKPEKTSLYTTSDLNTVLENGNDPKEVVNEIVNTKVANGKTEKEAKASVRSSLTSYWKDKYLEAYKKNDNEEMRRIRVALNSTGIYDNVVETCQRWVKSSK